MRRWWFSRRQSCAAASTVHRRRTRSLPGRRQSRDVVVIVSFAKPACTVTPINTFRHSRTAAMQRSCRSQVPAATPQLSSRFLPAVFMLLSVPWPRQQYLTSLHQILWISLPMRCSQGGDLLHGVPAELEQAEGERLALLVNAGCPDPEPWPLLQNPINNSMILAADWQNLVLLE